MIESTAKYQCLACETLWDRSQLLGDELNKTCGDAFCGANVHQIVAENPAICVGTQVRATKDMAHNRNPMFPRYNIPKGSCGVVREIQYSRTRFGIDWNVKNVSCKFWSCTPSEIEPV